MELITRIQLDTILHIVMDNTVIMVQVPMITMPRTHRQTQVMELVHLKQAHHPPVRRAIQTALRHLLVPLHLPAHHRHQVATDS